MSLSAKKVWFSMSKTRLDPLPNLGRCPKFYHFFLTLPFLTNFMASDSFLTSRQPNPNYQRWIQSTILENEICS